MTQIEVIARLDPKSDKWQITTMGAGDQPCAEHYSEAIIHMIDALIESYKELYNNE